MRWAKCSPSDSPTARPVQGWSFSITIKLPMGPVVLARPHVVEVRTPEVRADYHHHAVGHPVLIGILPEIVHRIGQVSEQPLVTRIVLRGGIETAAEPEIGAHCRPGLERQHCELCLTAQGAVEAPDGPEVLCLLLELVLGRNCVRVRLQSFGRERRAVEGPRWRRSPGSRLGTASNRSAVAARFDATAAQSVSLNMFDAGLAISRSN